MVEVFSNFPIRFDKLPDEDWNDIIEDGAQALEAGMRHAIGVTNAAVKKREQEQATHGSHVDKVGPTLDVSNRFVDDLYEKTVHMCLAECYEVSKPEDLWDDTDSASLNKKVNTMNVIRQRLAISLQQVRRKIISHYPVQGEAAVYKKCNYCGMVYVKPAGCDNIGECGGGGYKKDKDHPADMNLKLNYDYSEEHGLQLFDANQKGPGSRNPRKTETDCE